MLTEEQKRERLTGIGGSEASAVIGLSKWKTPLQVYLEKTGQTEIQEIEGNKNIDVGNKAEPYLRNIYAKRTGYNVDAPNKMFRCENNPFMVANIDGLVTSENTVLEIKTASEFMEKKWGEEGSDYIPEDYLFQIAHYSSVLKPKRVDVAVSFLDDTAKDVILTTEDGSLIEFLLSRKFRIFHYYTNVRLERSLADKEREFWTEHVEKLIPPIPCSYNEAKLRWSEFNDQAKVATLDVIDVVEELKKIQQQIDQLSKIEDEKKTFICNYLGDEAAILLDTDGTKLASWVNENRNRLDTERFKKENPEIYQKYLTTFSGRVFRLPRQRRTG